VGARRDQRDAGDAGSGRVPDPRGRARGDARPQGHRLSPDADRRRDPGRTGLFGGKQGVRLGWSFTGRLPRDFRDVVAEFEAEIYQKPPRKSAGDPPAPNPYDLRSDVLEVDDRQALLRIRCESGTYIRKLCHDIGLATGVGAHMGHLRRTATDPFDDRDLHPLQDLVDGLTWAEEGDDAFLREVVRPAEDALVHLPSVTIAPSAARNVATGAPVYAPGVIDVDSVSEGGEGDDGDDTDRDPRSSPATP